jgi:hypothetical protein
MLQEENRAFVDLGGCLLELALAALWFKKRVGACELDKERVAVWPELLEPLRLPQVVTELIYMEPVKMQDLPEEYWARIPNYANCFANDVNFDDETMGFLHQDFPKRLSLWNLRPGVRGGMEYVDGHAADFRADGFKASSGDMLQDRLKVYCSDGQVDTAMAVDDDRTGGRRSARAPAVNGNVMRLITRLESNDVQLGMLRLKDHVADINNHELHLILDALAKNDSVRVVHLQNTPADDSTIVKLINMLLQKRIWGVNLGEWKQVTAGGWSKLLEAVPRTHLICMYIDDPGTGGLTKLQKRQFRAAIRHIREEVFTDWYTDDTQRAIVNEEDKMWWNPKRSKYMTSQVNSAVMDVVVRHKTDGDDGDDELSDQVTSLSLEDDNKRSRSVCSSGNPRELKSRHQTTVDNDALYKEVVTQRQHSQREVTEPPETNMSLDDDAVSNAPLPEGWQRNYDEQSKRPYYSGPNALGEEQSTWFPVAGSTYLKADAPAQQQVNTHYAQKKKQEDEARARKKKQEDEARARKKKQEDEARTQGLIEMGDRHHKDGDLREALSCYEEAHGTTKDIELQGRLTVYIDELRPKVEKERRDLANALMDRS